MPCWVQGQTSPMPSAPSHILPHTLVQPTSKCSNTYCATSKVLLDMESSILVMVVLCWGVKLIPLPLSVISAASQILTMPRTPTLIAPYLELSSCSLGDPSPGAPDCNQQYPNCLPKQNT